MIRRCMDAPVVYCARPRQSFSGQHLETLSGLPFPSPYVLTISKVNGSSVRSLHHRQNVRAQPWTQHQPRCSLAISKVNGSSVRSLEAIYVRSLGRHNVNLLGEVCGVVQ